MRHIQQITFLFLVIFGLIACQVSKTKKDQQKETTVLPSSTAQALSGAEMDSTEARKTIATKADAIVQAIANQNFRKLAMYVHPTRGLRFSPYANIGQDLRR